jgi:lipoate-protein ligase A
VRRPTGGKAILHTDELTYAVIAPTSDPRLAGSVLESYQRLSKALLRALDLLGIPATADEKAPGNSNHHSSNPVCFEIPSNYEITFQGRKLIGSAQLVARTAYYSMDPTALRRFNRIVQVLHYKSETSRQAAAKRLLAKRHGRVLLRHPVPWNRSRCFCTGFRANP